MICGLVGLFAAGVVAASADGLTVPTVSTPTVTVPSLPVPTLPQPTLPTPTAPLPTAPAPTVPLPTAPAPTVPTATSPVPAPTPPAPATNARQPVVTTTAGGAPAPATVAGGAPSRGSPATGPARSFRVSGTRDTARRRRAGSSIPELRRVIARFVLARPARIRISIEELAPVCRALRSYLVRLPKGAHDFRFPAARVTETGTYRLIATLRDRELFSVRARRMPARVKLGGTENVCPQLTTQAAAYTLSLPGTSAAGGGQLHVKGAHARREAATPTSGGRARARNPLVRAVSLTSAPKSLQPLLFTLLAIAIVLLALAAAPQRVLPAGRAAAIVAARRVYFAAAGIWLLVVVAIVTAFS